MDLVKNGESSTSPLRANPGLPPDVAGHGSATGQAVELKPDTASEATKTKLVLPQWDLFPPKPLHASQDLISLLHLDGIYHTHVLPYSDIVDDDGGQADGEGEPGKRKRTRSKMEKGYTHLLPDIIDPLPLGDKKENLALLSLLDTAPPEEEMVPISDEAFAVARLEVGTQDGVGLHFRLHRLHRNSADVQYERGEKKGVKEAEAKRRRRRETRQAQSMSVPPEIASLPSPALHAWDQPTPSSPGFAPPLPSQYTPRPSFSHARTASGGAGASRGGTPSRGGIPHHLGKRPWDGTPGGGTPKRGRGTPFRTGSETPRGRGRPNYPQGFRSKTDY